MPDVPIGPDPAGSPSEGSQILLGIVLLILLYVSYMHMSTLWPLWALFGELFTIRGHPESSGGLLVRRTRPQCVPGIGQFFYTLPGQFRAWRRLPHLKCT
jgi:hypothetical protein